MLFVSGTANWAFPEAFRGQNGRVGSPRRRDLASGRALGIPEFDENPAKIFGWTPAGERHDATPGLVGSIPTLGSYAVARSSRGIPEPVDVLVSIEAVGGATSLAPYLAFFRR